jgi:nitrate reductase beta subunit
VFLDPNEEEVIAEARKAGINDAWIQAAQRSPVYRMAVDWKIALPLHPEFRTLPMVWYVPPLSPILNHVENESAMNAESYISLIDGMSIPMDYLASILAAGDAEIVRRALIRLVAMRAMMRNLNVGDPVEEVLLKESGLDRGDLISMARLLGVAKYDERFVIPTANTDERSDTFETQGTCSLENIAPPEGFVQLKPKKRGGGP